MWSDDRPLGITVISILGWLYGGWTLLLGVMTIVFNPLSIFGLSPIFAIITGLTYIVAGFGLWAMQGWGWRTAIFVNIFGLVFALISMAVPLLIVHGLVLAYLFTVRESFDQH